MSSLTNKLNEHRQSAIESGEMLESRLSGYIDVCGDLEAVIETLSDCNIAHLRSYLDEIRQRLQEARLHKRRAPQVIRIPFSFFSEAEREMIQAANPGVRIEDVA